MLGTKVEIKMKKAEPRSWPKLEYATKNRRNKESINDLTPRVEGVDLDDL